MSKLDSCSQIIGGAIPMIINGDDAGFKIVKNQIPYKKLGENVYLVYVILQKNKKYLMVAEEILEGAGINEKQFHEIACDTIKHISPTALEVGRSCDSTGNDEEPIGVLLLGAKDGPGSGVVFNRDFMESTAVLYFPEGFYIVTADRFYCLAFSKKFSKKEIYQYTHVIQKTLAPLQESLGNIIATDSYVPIFDYDLLTGDIKPARL